MIEIKHRSATLRVLPENAQQVHDLLALIDKTNGRRGRKLRPEKPENAHERDMAKWAYPVFTPGMETMEYIREYEYHNIHHCLSQWQYVCADRPAAMLDPTTPECVEEP